RAARSGRCAGRRPLREVCLPSAGALLQQDHRGIEDPVRRSRRQERMSAAETALLEPPPQEAEVLEGTREEEVRPQCTLVIFGASGDLTRRLLAPAITHLLRDGMISPDFAIIRLPPPPMIDPPVRPRPDGGA